MAKEDGYSISVDGLILENFRCFKSLEIRFEEQLTVIISENGGGKTAILEAITGCLNNYLASLKVSGYKKMNVASKDVNIGQNSANCLLSTDLEYGVQQKFRDFEDQLTDEIVFEEETVTLDYSYSVHEIIHSAFKSHVLPLNKVQTTAISLPVLVYFGGESVSVEYNSKLSTNPERLKLIYQNTLTGTRFAFTHFYNWWKSNEDRMLRTKAGTPQYNTIDYQLKKIKTAVEYLMNDDGVPLVYKNLRINEDLEMGMDKIIYEDDREVNRDFIEISQFSAGEKSLFAFVADLGLRLLQANPLEASPEKEGLRQIRGKGVALIDEVGLHLHPKWQQKVIEKLLYIFPDMQFIMTTHSPLVLSYSPLSRGIVYRLRNGGVEQINKFSGMRLIDIFYDLYDTPDRPPQIQKEIDKLFEAIDDEDKELAKKRLNNLRTILYKEDPAIVEAETSLKYL